MLFGFAAFKSLLFSKMTSVPLVLKWNDANTISVNKPGTNSSISFINDGSTRKIGAYYTTSDDSPLTSFELSHGTQSKFTINKADGETGALEFETDLDDAIQTGNSLRLFQSNGDTAFWLVTGNKSDGYTGSNMFEIFNTTNAVIIYGGADSLKRNGVVIKRFTNNGSNVNGIELTTAYNSDLSQSHNSIKIYHVTNPDFDAITLGSGYYNDGSAQEPNYKGRNYIEMQYPGNSLTSHMLWSRVDGQAALSLYSVSNDEAIGLHTSTDSNEFVMTNRQATGRAFRMLTDSGTNKTSNEFYIHEMNDANAFVFTTNTGTNGASNQFTAYNSVNNIVIEFKSDVGDNHSSQLSVYNSTASAAFEFNTDQSEYRSNVFRINDKNGRNAFLFETNIYGGSSSDMNKLTIYDYNSESSAIELASNIDGSNWYHGSVLRFYNHENTTSNSKLAVELGTGVDMTETNDASALRFYNVNKTGSQPDYALEYIARDYNTTLNTTILNHLKINSNAGPYLELATDGELSSSAFGIRIIDEGDPEMVKLYCNNSTSKVDFQIGDAVSAASGFEFITLDTTLGASNARNLFMIRRPDSTGDAFMFSSTNSLSNNFSVYNSESVASTTLITNIHINNTGIVLPLKFQSSDTTVPTATNTEGICVFDSEALTATSADATKTAMLKRTVPSTYAVQQALGSIVSLNIAPFELEATTDAQGKGLLFRIKLPAASSATGADQYYEFDFSAKTHGYKP